MLILISLVLPLLVVALQIRIEDAVRFLDMTRNIAHIPWRHCRVNGGRHYSGLGQNANPTLGIFGSEDTIDLDGMAQFRLGPLWNDIILARTARSGAHAETMHDATDSRIVLGSAVGMTHTTVVRITAIRRLDRNHCHRWTLVMVASPGTAEEVALEGPDIIKAGSQKSIATEKPSHKSKITLVLINRSFFAGPTSVGIRTAGIMTSFPAVMDQSMKRLVGSFLDGPSRQLPTHIAVHEALLASPPAHSFGQIAVRHGLRRGFGIWIIIFQFFGREEVGRSQRGVGRSQGGDGKEVGR